ncbi:MAG: hypothetical protein HOP15_14245 [Planctomycetes bacterium]|nr:hypothetical protein [Planctomycetota bacterium]
MSLLPVLLLASAQSGAVKPVDFYRSVVARAAERAHAEVRVALKFDVDHSRWEDPWVLTSAHYEVRTTHSYAQAAKISRDLEFMYAEFVKLLGEGPAQSAPRRVWVFPTLAAYNVFGNEVGAEHSSLLGTFFANQHPEQPVAAYQNGNPTLLGMWITHGALHQYLEQSFGPQRLTWVDEGLAAYFSLFFDWAYAARELERIERGPSCVSLERLVREPIQAYANLPDDRFIQLGMLFHFLLNFCEATRNGATGDPAAGPFQDSLRAAVRGKDVSEDEFMQSLEEAADLLEEDFKNFDFAKQ